MLKSMIPKSLADVLAALHIERFFDRRPPIVAYWKMRSVVFGLGDRRTQLHLHLFTKPAPVVRVTIDPQEKALRYMRSAWKDERNPTIP
jgi:hypothetical protein